MFDGLRELFKERGKAFWFMCAAIAAFVTELIACSLIRWRCERHSDTLMSWGNTAVTNDLPLFEGDNPCLFPL